MRCMEQPKVQNTEPQLCLIWRRSWALLSARYSWRHCAGAALCVASLGLLVATDVSQPNQAGSQMKPAAGDAIVLAGAALYALSNVAQEKLLRESPVLSSPVGLRSFRDAHAHLPLPCWKACLAILPTESLFSEHPCLDRDILHPERRVILLFHGQSTDIC